MDKLNTFLEVDKNYKRSILLLFILFMLLRSFQITSPILDRHSWNQVSTAATAMNIYKDPASFWKPDFSAIQFESDSSIMAQEFPIFMGLLALGYSVFGPHTIVARLIAIAIALVGWIYLFRLCRLSESRTVSLIILFIYTVNSHNWFFDRAINSDTGMVSFMLVAFFYFVEYLEKKTFRAFILLTLATTLAGLFKPFGLMIGVSFLFYLWRRKNLWALKDPLLLLMGLIAWSVNISWLLYTKFYLSNSIGLGHRLGFNLGTLFSLEFPYVMSQRFFDQILSPFLAFFYLFALFSRKVRTDIGSALFAGNIFYLVYITHGNMEHNYYQLPITPALCIYAGLGFCYWLSRSSERFSKRFRERLAIFIMIGFMLYSGKRAWNHFRLASGPKIVGDQVQSLNLDPETLILAVETSGTRYHEIIYYSGLRGYVARNVNPETIAMHKKKGVKYVVVHLEEKEMNDPAFMKPLQEDLTEIWSSHNCKDTYSRPCFIGIYEIVP
jgi:4-amino-4-deoxy-L-arabinose transferase-like glycosyltransferase